ncbi:MAG: hypothetical protein ABIJ96_08685 [Elusimicrobiota bacterium]
MNNFRWLLVPVLSAGFMLGACSDSDSDSEAREALTQEKAKLEQQKAELWKMRYELEKEKKAAAPAQEKAQEPQ